MDASAMRKTAAAALALTVRLRKREATRRVVSFVNRARPELTVPISGRLDLNQRPFDPQSNALPNCATPRA